MADPTRPDLESKITFLEGTIDALNEVILDQGKRIEQLEGKLHRFEERLSGVEGEQDEVDPLTERPPHY